MYTKNDKRRLYWLIECFIEKKIDESTFCNEFYYSYDLEIDVNDLNEQELNLFDELNAIASRFSPYESDYNLDKRAFTTKEQLREKIAEVYIKLKKV
jgi:hypothetical protein